MRGMHGVEKSLGNPREAPVGPLSGSIQRFLLREMIKNYIPIKFDNRLHMVRCSQPGIASSASQKRATLKCKKNIIIDIIT